MKSLKLSGMVLLAAAGLMMGCVDEPASPDATVGEVINPNTSEIVETTETVDVMKEESSIKWVGRKVTRKHDGSFGEFDGSLSFTNGDPTAIAFEIDMSSIVADNDRLTGHLKSGDFFLVEEHPTAMFESTSIEPAADGNYEITGNLTMRGTAKSISFPATVDMSGETIHATSAFTINRHDWGVSYAGAPDDLIKDEVEIMLDMRFPQPGGADHMTSDDMMSDDMAGEEGSRSGEVM